MGNDLKPTIAALDDLINLPRQLPWPEPPEVRDYRHAIYNDFARHLRAISLTFEEQTTELSRLQEENERLKAAISWVRPPFVDDQTTPEEIRKRIAFLITDADGSRASHEQGDADAPR